MIEEGLGACIDPVEDLVAISQFAETDRADLLALTLWLALTLTTAVEFNVDMKDRGPFTWEPVRLNTGHIEFSIHEKYAEYVVTNNEDIICVEHEGQLVSTVN